MMMHQNDNYIVIVTVEDSFYQQGGMIAIFIVGAYLVLASCCITYMFSKVMKERLEKEKTDIHLKYGWAYQMFKQARIWKWYEKA